MTDQLNWPAVLHTLLLGQSLDSAATRWAMNEIMAGEASPAQVAAFAIALRAKGESAQEVGGLVEAMLDNATPVSVPGRCVDVVGTGGDRARTVNISTMAAIVTAGAGIPVAKHGNRAASSACGSADLLAELGVVIDLPPAGVARCVSEAGIGFFFAPVFHPGMRHAAVARREMGVATVFNFLGPLTNPSQPAAQAVGCADPRMAGVMAAVLAARGTSAVVFRGDDGLDEITTTTTSRLWLVAEGSVAEITLDPVDLGLARSQPADLVGGGPAENAAVARDVIAGAAGPVREAVLVNAAAAVVAFDGFEGFASGDEAGFLAAMRGGLERAAASIDGGGAAETLRRWRDVSQAGA
ncbi:MAG: anthranilate phosphoribosyltransferase [Geodermatophilaceae bacterium]|nr:anthranilate phosphoribosyltransferase [Geodermatophilaceae bacterium]